MYRKWQGVEPTDETSLKVGHYFINALLHVLHTVTDHLYF